MDIFSILSEYAESFGAHSSLKQQPDGSQTLFICVGQLENSYDEGITSWEHVITIDRFEEKVKIRYRNGKKTNWINSQEAKKAIQIWINDPK